MVWSIGVFRLFGRFGGALSVYAFIAWLFLRAIEQTAPYAPLVLALSAGFFVLAVYRMRTAVTVASRGVPVDGTLYAFDTYYTAARGDQRSNRIRRLNFTYEFEGQQYKGKSTWMPKSASREMPLYTTIPLVVDPVNPQRAYWVREAPDLFAGAHANS